MAGLYKRESLRTPAVRLRCDSTRENGHLVFDGVGSEV